MGVFWNPAQSSAFLMASICPSIIPEGAMMSAPAFAWDTAIFP